MLGGRDPSAMLAPLRDAGVAHRGGLRARSPRALPAEVVAEAARALGLRVSVAGSVAERGGAGPVAASPRTGSCW